MLRIFTSFVVTFILKNKMIKKLSIETFQLANMKYITFLQNNTTSVII